MGWLFYDRKPDNVKEHLMGLATWERRTPAGTAGTALDCAIVNLRTAYLAVRLNYPDKPSQVVALIYLLQFPRGERGSPGGFGYKDMDESMGPVESNCPERILKRLSPLPDAPAEGKDPYEYARAWRARCWANLEARREAKGKKVVGTRLVSRDPAGVEVGLPQKITEFEVIHPWGHPANVRALQVIAPEIAFAPVYRPTARLLAQLDIKQVEAQ